jgi:endonuclease/exonuclease/phosphatase family metal-dependent hydrolase
MSYNVENLFDTIHDVENGIHKNDYTFLPTSKKHLKRNCKVNRSFYRKRECLKTNWTKKKLDKKISQIKKVVLQNKMLPDFLALTEVENKRVVKQLATKLGYKFFLISKSMDQRGIDVALLYKERIDIKFIKKKELILTGKEFSNRPTRNILEGNFLIDNKYSLTIFVNHWPSQSNPSLSRLKAAQFLKTRISEIVKSNRSEFIIITGDFNTIAQDRPHAFNDALLEGEALVDLHKKFMNSKYINKSFKETFPLGTYFYSKKMSWNLLDRVFYSKNFNNKKKLRINIESYRIFAPYFMTKSYQYNKRGHYLYGSKVTGVPFGFNNNGESIKEVGFSDHFPIIFTLEY